MPWPYRWCSDVFPATRMVWKPFHGQFLICTSLRMTQLPSDWPEWHNIIVSARIKLSKTPLKTPSLKQYIKDACLPPCKSNKRGQNQNPPKAAAKVELELEQTKIVRTCGKRLSCPMARLRWSWSGVLALLFLFHLAQFNLSTDFGTWNTKVSWVSWVHFPN